MVSIINSLKNHQGFKKYLFNTGWLMMDKVLRLFVGLFVGIWVARYLGPEDFGVLSFAMSLVGLFGAFAKLGLDGIVVRNIIHSHDDKDAILGTSFILRIIGAFSLFGWVYVALQFTSATVYEQIIVMVVAFGQLFTSFEIIDFYFQSQIKGKYSGIAGSLALGIVSIAKITFILLSLPLIWFAGAVIIEQATKAVFFILYYVKLTKDKAAKPFKEWQFSLNTAKNLLRDSWPLILSGIVVSIYMKIDQVMIKEMLDSEAVGQYAVAVGLSEAWYFIPIVIASSLFPAIINAKKQSEALYYARLQKLYDFMAWLAISIAIPTLFLADQVILLLYGEAYHPSGGVLALHIWAGVFVFLGVASSKWFISENLQKYSFYRTLAGAITNVILNFILIPRYGIYGAATATLISQAVASYLFNLTNKKLRYTFFLQTNAILFPLRKLGVKFG